MVVSRLSGQPEVEKHNHRDYEVATGDTCESCGEKELACAMCGEPLHTCPQPSRNNKEMRIPRGFRQVKDFPEYMVDRFAAVRHIATGRYCTLVRINPESNHAMIHVYREGKRHTKSAQALRDEVFAEDMNSRICKTCGHHRDQHWMEANTKMCLRPGCACKIYNQFGKKKVDAEL